MVFRDGMFFARYAPGEGYPTECSDGIQRPLLQPGRGPLRCAKLLLPSKSIRLNRAYSMGLANRMRRILRPKMDPPPAPRPPTQVLLSRTQIHKPRVRCRRQFLLSQPRTPPGRTRVALRLLSIWLNQKRLARHRLSENLRIRACKAGQTASPGSLPSARLRITLTPQTRL